MFPIGDDNPTRNKPFVTYGLIIANIAVFVGVNVMTPPEETQQIWSTHGYQSAEPLGLGVLTYQFLHGDWLHILNNLWMLWIVGDNVEDKLGHGRYLLTYLAAGVAAAWVFSATGQIFNDLPLIEGVREPPLVGASGSIFGMMGMYLIFFPEARIRILLWFLLLIQVIRVRAKWVIGMWLGLEVWRTLQAHGPSAGHVATSAHVGGGVFGILLAIWLKPRIGGGGDGDAWDVHTGFAKRSTSSTGDQYAATGARSSWFESPAPPEDSLLELEDRMIDLVRRGEMRHAIDLYPRYEAMHRERPLPGDIQIEIAHEYYEQGLHRDALAAYQRYLSTEPGGEERAEAQFRVGVIYARWLDDPVRARGFLQAAARAHPDPEIRRFAGEELQRL